MSKRRITRIQPAEAKELLDGMPTFHRRPVPVGVYDRWLEADQIPLHGTLDGTPQEIASREAWFCHNYPMAECHRGAYEIGVGTSVVFANDGWPDYNLTFMEQWLGKQEIDIVGRVVEDGYTTLLLVEYEFLDELDDAIWAAWHFRCNDQVTDQQLFAPAVIYAHVQRKIAAEVMGRLGVECAPPNLDAGSVIADPGSA